MIFFLPIGVKKRIFVVTNFRMWLYLILYKLTNYKT